ncbi:hypothetical protein [Pseudoalteromonas luteoviolacea]|uniref:Lipoprotein n=1 Tax=Pseudoalteromonas luteoviolacea S4054 TaxID=1129367 RepID=A0A0F6A7Q2_9GAMM|nr:hypothetical protein [Pseudoalteromonas luteoviolacea]AOT11103.1 hypothetical protein S4054249_25050 [Pseudoalteromonas luteoviolacea]AOT15733.1 hypothetical protein S40542_23460 [Pseudoalteromonas luteoviolacea]AOT20924.1 hypothetical protein S4054_24970 [Pseudoalteromonas luteoviolacea]KKE82205.1 hypothetical protein N479_19095 [Pseudoalteromonas luteoviolacea S4054]KZN65463.1 hypothetical protein N481_25240 [Pseudoalteromonas luteoviolacea S4047-1]
MRYLGSAGLFVLVTTLFGCGSDSSGPTTPQPPSESQTEKIVTGVELHLFNRELNSTLSKEDINRGDSYQENTPIKYNHLIFGLDTATDIVTLKASLFNLMPLSLISKAYALSPVPETTKENIQSIVITSPYDFNETAPAGSNLNPFFSVSFASFPNQYYVYKDDKRIYTAVNEYIETADGEPLKSLGFSTDLILNTAPDAGYPMSFYIEMTLDDGRVFSLESPEIQFLKSGEE